MAPRESQKRASLKWDKENMTVLSCKIRKDQAAEFKAYCENQGSTSNTLLKDFVLGCIGEQTSESHQDGPGQPGGAGGISLHPSALKAAKEAAQSTGETVAQFIERAVQTQAQRDKSSLGLGINPATGDKMTREA